VNADVKGKAVNILGSVMIWKTDMAVEMVPRSDRKSYRDFRPDYRRAHRIMPISSRPRWLAILRSSRRCGPRLRAKPAAYMMNGKLLCHPAIYDTVLRQFSGDVK